MARRFNSSIRPVQRVKHVIDAEGSVDDTPTVVVPIIKASDAPILTSPTLVQTGSSVNGFYCHVEVSHTSGTGRPNIYLFFAKNPGGNITNFPSPKATGINDNKRQIIHQEMILMSGDASNGLPRPLFTGVVVIPKGMRRFGPSDSIDMHIITGNAGINADWCLQAHYKEFR